MTKNYQVEISKLNRGFSPGSSGYGHYALGFGVDQSTKGLLSFFFPDFTVCQEGDLVNLKLSNPWFGLKRLAMNEFFGYRLRDSNGRKIPYLYVESETVVKTSSERRKSKTSSDEYLETLMLSGPLPEK